VTTRSHQRLLVVSLVFLAALVPLAQVAVSSPARASAPVQVESSPGAAGVPLVCQERVTNGGFESGLPPAPWVESSAFEIVTNDAAPGAPTSAHAGHWFAWLGGYDDALDVISQTVSLPAGMVQTLSFWWHIQSEESGSTAFDSLDVML